MVTFLKICDSLDIDLSQFFKKTDDNISKEYIILEKIKKLDNEDYKVVENTVYKLCKNQSI